VALPILDALAPAEDMSGFVRRRMGAATVNAVPIPATRAP